MEKIATKHIGISIVTLKCLLIGYLLYTFWPTLIHTQWTISTTFLQFVLIGFVAQIIDGALGMAYGVSCSSLLMQIGVAPKLASAAVHTAEVFTTGVSGLSHIKLNNIDRPLFFKIVLTGVLGAVLGAYLISEIFDGKVIKPFISAYLLILGGIILWKGLKNNKKVHKLPHHKKTPVLAFFGGLLDAIGGGGWGPIVTSNLIHSGNNPRLTIGTVNTAEFFVTFFSTGVFMFFVGVESWQIVLGLIVGGVIAAPIGAILASKINKRTLLILVGIVIVITSGYTLYKTLS